jgi:TonB family protein
MRDHLVRMAVLLAFAVAVAFGAGLDFRAQERQGNLRLTWNAAAARSATAGTLSVEDGDFQRTIQLNGEHLRQGNLTYAPQGSHVIFRLRVGAATETVEVGRAPIAIPPAAVMPRTIARATRSLIPQASVPAAPARRSVSVRVTIDADGRVTKAVLVHGPDVDEDYAVTALAAARQWVFEPGPAEKVIEIREPAYR